jgi:hypothetical protein
MIHEYSQIGNAGNPPVEVRTTCGRTAVDVGRVSGTPAKGSRAASMNGQCLYGPRRGLRRPSHDMERTQARLVFNDSPVLTGPVGVRLNYIAGRVLATGRNYLPRHRLRVLFADPIHV